MSLLCFKVEKKFCGIFKGAVPCERIGFPVSIKPAAGGSDDILRAVIHGKSEADFRLNKALSAAEGAILQVLYKAACHFDTLRVGQNGRHDFILRESAVSVDPHRHHMFRFRRVHEPHTVPALAQKESAQEQANRKHHMKDRPFFHFHHRYINKSHLIVPLYSFRFFTACAPKARSNSVWELSKYNSHPDSARNADCLAHFEKAAETAVNIGCKIVSTLVPLPFGAKAWHFNPAAPAIKQSYRMPAGYCYKKDWETLMESYRKCLAIAKKHGLRMSVECFPGSIISTPHAMLKLLEDVNDPDFGIQLDTNHLVAQHIDPEWSIYVLGGEL